MRMGLRLYISDPGVGSIAWSLCNIIVHQGNKNFPKENSIIILSF